ncbi:3-alpha,7-alpha,12-alpha-trihydroxy-5-beta-cholest-24-enoyl-CoA hydratase [Tardibacter chloracetimidivorans]|uniref:3-alpha,7-alpha, 12-alpha-trihydroxy-5-beta-cholest-24-enoyl-CoA hydratase n=1 Tax=Tardibacter chloracetimidivorans TaxID=1921510 RepID=A0A1L3ZWB9_9SPHN|nr:MaoC/PaaZ C-terminal domain-containing protein [Tardibacter chloracetimidivorans]API59923.1 3-alpha,7-alpha,12-alpha-trihydroxy-5-beta-cholest-24-enoyl-CoA hydratase [Tardibacter chloracetimidivorans]
MTADYKKLLALKIPDTVQEYGEKDTILYALGLGLGSNPNEPAELKYVYEDGLSALPMMAVVLAHPGFWMRDLDTGLDWVRIVHGEQQLTVHKPLPVSGRVIGRTRVLDIVDKGPGKGALLYQERAIHDADSDELLCTGVQTTFCRGDGGMGGSGAIVPPPPAIPDREPDMIVERATLPQAALIYRLAADRNPLHADPQIARKAGFDRPILHGLATYGVAGVALISALCGNDPARLRSLRARFTSPVFPGETLQTEIWREADGARYRVRVRERGVVAIDNGLVEFDPD